MNKALQVLVYLFLILAGAALWFEIQLDQKRSLLTDRNRLQEDYYVRIARTIEKAEPNKDTTFAIKKDASPVENKIVDSPEMENVLDDYNGYLEQPNLETFDWENQKSREQLRMIYVLDAEGKPVMDGNEPLKRGPGTEDELLGLLFESAKTQQARLNSTRGELTTLRGKLEKIVGELNELKPIARQDKVTIDEKNAKIAKLEEEKRALEDEITRKKAEIEQLNADLTSVRDELASVKDELEEKKEEIAKNLKTIEQLKALLKEALMARAARKDGQGGGAAVTSLPIGDKGKIVEADNENLYAVVEFTPEAMKELRGDNESNPLPLLELGVKRPGFNGPAGEFVGRLKIRQEVRGKNYVICDILGSWAQDKIQKDDVIFAD